MNKKLLFALFTLTLFTGFSQQLTFKGSIYDTLAKRPLPKALIVLTRHTDSSLVNFTRTNTDGIFELQNMPVDTYKVMISHPQFGDKILYLIGSDKKREFVFEKMILPPKSVNLDEVTILAYKDPVFYKGDTLIYTADSFKVKANASLEDLLKRLPGVKVDAKGKITAQGKEVSKVLVDGDEFFGADPTMATRNLAANSVESVQVYEKKDENASAESTSDETIKVMNLKLKDDAKKGYFGKVSGGSDGTGFHQGEVLVNKFRNKQKISFFALGANTPKTGFGWEDIDKYGLDNERNYSWDEDNGFMMNEAGEGIPRTWNAGVYYNDKWSKKTKVNANYSYKNNRLQTESEQRSQYFLTDTAYVTNNKSINTTENQNHFLQFTVIHDIDSVTKLTVSPKATLNLNQSEGLTTNNFATTEGVVTRETSNLNRQNGEGQNLGTTARLTKNFSKKDRLLTVNYGIDYNLNASTGLLQTTNNVFSGPNLSLLNIDQKKISESSSLNQNSSVSFFEPFTKKWKGEIMYEFTHSTNAQMKNSLNSFNGDYTQLDSVFSNDFSNIRYIHQAKARLIFEVKKYRISAGTRARQVNLTNTNNFNGAVFNQEVRNLLPFMNFNYNFNQNTRLFLNYNTNSQQPSINQLQPLPNNANQNFITLGNPDLRPTLAHQLNLNFNSYKPVSGKYFWAGGNFRLVQDAFSSNLVYDSLGRSVSTPVNIDGNYNGNGWLGGNLPMFGRVLALSINGNAGVFSNNNFINGLKNTTRTSNIGGNAGINVTLEKFFIDFNAGYDYHMPSSTAFSQNNQPYYTQTFNGSTRLELPKKFFVESDASYTINSRRTAGFNLNIFIVNAAVSKNFGKLENFILSVKAYDLLNQNVSAGRQVYDNIITDNKTKIISRYFLLVFTYKFNSQKTKDSGEED